MGFETTMNITPKDLLDAGVHFGHQLKRWNPKSKPYSKSTYKSKMESETKNRTQKSKPKLRCLSIPV